MAEVFVNNGQTTVATAYTAGGTTLVVADGSKLPTLGGSDQCHVVVYTASAPSNAEIMRVTARSGNTLTVVPAAETIAGVSTSQNHPVGDVVANEISVQSLTNFIEQLSLSQAEADALYAALSHTHTFASLTSKPTTLSGYGITDAQPLDATLTAFAALTIAANTLTIGTGADAFSQTAFAASTFPARASTGNLEAKSITDFALTILDDADAATVRATIGAGVGDVTAASNLTDNAVVRGDGGAKGVQTSAVTIDDSGNLTARTLLATLTSTSQSTPDLFTLTHAASGFTPTDGFGFTTTVRVATADLTNNDLITETYKWTTVAAATRASQYLLHLHDFAAARQIIDCCATGSAAAIGFLGVAAAATQTGDAGTALVTFGLMSGTPTFAAANLSGTTLPAAIVSSSLTSVGTIATGVWSGTAIVVAKGGTGVTSLTAHAVLCGGTTSTGAVQSVSGTGTVGQVLTSNGTGVLPTWQDPAGDVGTGTGPDAANVLRGYIDGLILSNNGADASNDIDIAAGECADSTGVVMLVGTALTKRLDATWAAGTNQGGLDTGAEANSTWYHMWAILKDSDSTVDYLFSTSVSAPTMPAGYTYKRRLGSVYNDGSGNLRAFVQDGDTFLLSTAIQDANAAATSGTAALLTVSVPTGLKVEVLYRANIASTNNAMLFTSPDESDQAPGTNHYSAIGASLGIGGAEYRVRTNTSAQIRHRATGADDFNLWTYGWVDRRGKE